MRLYLYHQHCERYQNTWSGQILAGPARIKCDCLCKDDGESPMHWDSDYDQYRFDDCHADEGDFNCQGYCECGSSSPSWRVYLGLVAWMGRTISKITTLLYLDFSLFTIIYLWLRNRFTSWYTQRMQFNLSNLYPIDGRSFILAQVCLVCPWVLQNGQIANLVFCTLSQKLIVIQSCFDCRRY